jgi:dedicator of cytokinesis protein 3
MENCHVFFTFRSRGAKHRGTISGPGVERPFAFAYFPLFLDNAAFQPDGSHNLVLYRYDRSVAVTSSYFQAPSTYEHGRQLPALPASVAKTLVPLRDTMIVRSFLVSTKYTQNETLLKLLRWETELLRDGEKLRDSLTKLR